MTAIERALNKLQAEKRASQPNSGPRVKKEQCPRRAVSQGDTATIDMEHLKRAGLNPGPDARGIDLRRQFQAMKRPLLANAFDPNLGIDRANMIVVTSALPDAGKTFVTVNLAVSLGLERDNGVVLIDGDVAHRHLTRALGMDATPGLMELLLDQDRNVRDMVLETRVQGLRFLPAGSPQPHATELLASEHMAEIAARLAEEYSREIVLWDSPPLLITNEAVVLASLMGQVLLVVEAGSTSKAAVHDTLRLLEKLKGDRAVNLILNKTTQSIVESQYGDYGADGYRHAHGS